MKLKPNLAICRGSDPFYQFTQFELDDEFNIKELRDFTVGPKDRYLHITNDQIVLAEKISERGSIDKVWYSIICNKNNKPALANVTDIPYQEMPNIIKHLCNQYMADDDDPELPEFND